MINHSEMRKFLQLGFRSKVFLYFLVMFYPWIQIHIFFRIRIQEAKILRIQRIRILSTSKNSWDATQNSWDKQYCETPNAVIRRHKTLPVDANRSCWGDTKNCGSTKSCWVNCWETPNSCWIDTKHNCCYKETPKQLLDTHISVMTIVTISKVVT